MKSNILIIKLGALGDVVRTTSLLRVLDGNIFWVTAKSALPLLPADKLKVIEINEAETLSNLSFDLILCLDDDYKAANLATMLKKKTLIGSYIDKNNSLTYTDSSREWFDMGLMSRFGKEKADAIKKANKKTYQEIIFRMCGNKFNEEEYLLNQNLPKPRKQESRTIIGIEARAGDRWPMKQWNKWQELAAALKADGCEVRFFVQRQQIADYVQDINECDLVICGDTLAMHIALSLKKRIVAIFICTSPTEIYDYGRMIKITSPFLKRVFYRRDYIPEAVNAISVKTVYQSVRDSLFHVK
ncbi:glycosyltransferase family 9 protein [bacterium]|nr:glycosyltransferase family 9 protein [bacterium]